MINIYVVWCLDGPIMTTLLQYPDTREQRKAMKGWSNQDYVEQAYDAEFLEEDGSSLGHQSYELAAIFESPSIHFIY